SLPGHEPTVRESAHARSSLGLFGQEPAGFEVGVAVAEEVMREVGDALAAKYLLIGEQVAGAGSGITPDNRQRGVRHDLRAPRAPGRDVLPQDGADRLGPDRGRRPQR